MRPHDIDFTLFAGASFERVLRWFGDAANHQPITAVQQGWPTTVTAPNHGLTGLWPIWISNVRVPRSLNTEYPQDGGASHCATVIDANTLAVDVNTGNETGTYSGAGVLTSFPIVPLAGYTADLQVRSSPLSEIVLLELSTANGGITLNANTGEITLQATPAQTALLQWRQGVYDLLLTSPTGVVTRFATGVVTVEQDITRS